MMIKNDLIRRINFAHPHILRVLSRLWWKWLFRLWDRNQSIYYAGPIPEDEGLCFSSRLVLFSASTNPAQGKWLAKLAAYRARQVNRPILAIELGSCLGVSGMYILLGMHEGCGGHLVTFERVAMRLAITKKNFDRFINIHGLHNISYEQVAGSFEDSVGNYFSTLEKPVDLAFIDGHHEYAPTLKYHRLARGKLAPKGIIVHDDIAHNEGMVRAWSQIMEEDDPVQVIVLYQGGRPSRGILFYDQEKAGTRHLNMDSFLVRRMRIFFHFSMKTLRLLSAKQPENTDRKRG